MYNAGVYEFGAKPNVNKVALVVFDSQVALAAVAESLMQPTSVLDVLIYAIVIRVAKRNTGSFTSLYANQ